MTEKANPSINRPAEAFKTAGAIAYGGSTDGYISPASEPTEISIQDGGIDESNLNAFEQTSSTSSLDVTIDGGEAFVFGSWLAIDTTTTVSLDASTSGQTVYVGWNKNGSDDVIVGTTAAFSDAAGDADQKIELYSFDTDGSGVVAVEDRRSFDQINAESVEQGAGSGLDADSVDGSELSDIDSTYVNESGDTMSGPLTLGGDLTATDAETIWDESAGYIPQLRLENESLTVAGNSVSLGSSTAVNHADLSNIGSSDHHTRYSDEEAQDAVAGSFLNAGNGLVKEYLDNSNELTLEIATDAIQETELDESITPTWSGKHTFSDGITGLPEPTQDSDAARKVYVDSIAEGLDIKESVRVCAESNIDLSSSTDPNPVDGVTLADGDRVLLKQQTDGTENGIYVASTATDPTTWARSDDADEDTEVTSGLFVFVEAGNTHTNQGFVLSTNDPITLGATSLTFTQFSGAESFTAGSGITQTNNTISHTDTSSQSDVTSASGSAIVDLTFDTFGHVTGATTDSFDGRYVNASGDTLSGTLTLSDGSTAASRSWVNGNADVPNADFADNAGFANNSDEVDGYDVQKDGSDGTGIINFKTN
jgi:hypothetical protein